MALAVFALVLGIYARHNSLLPYLAGVYAVPSVLVFGLYGWDKRVAVRGGSRTSEQSLHLLALAGGGPVRCWLVLCFVTKPVSNRSLEFSGARCCLMWAR